MDNQYLDRGEGRIAFDDTGTGPLVVCVPGMGDLRSTFRFLVPALVESGRRVVTMDLRGHGDSDATFTSYDDEAAASDLIALVEHLAPQGGATVVGNSMGAGAAVIAAAQRPDLLSSLVLMGPFVRNPPGGAVMAAVFRVLMAPWWARHVWRAYLPTLYAGRRPGDFRACLDAISASMKRPGHAAAFSRTTRSSHAPAEAALPGVQARTLVVMGRRDPDFKDAEAEATWIADQVAGRVLMVDDAGHYPQSQRPDLVNPGVVEFLAENA